MSRRIVIAGLAALSALAVSAVAVSSAFAVPIESNTAFTCVPTKGGAFKNAHCNSAKPSDGGEYAHVAIAVNTKTQLTLTNIGNTELNSTIGGAAVKLTATGAECVKCMAENHEETVSGKTWMDVQGPGTGETGGHIHYSGVTINVAGCTVTGGEVNTEPLKLTTTTAGIGLLEPQTGTTMAVIHLNAACSIGETITVTGIARGTTAGSTATFNTGASELKIGKQEAHLIGEATIIGHATETTTGNPLALTAA
jgi:hypothetical protein